MTTTPWDASRMPRGSHDLVSGTPRPYQVHLDSDSQPLVPSLIHSSRRRLRSGQKARGEIDIRGSEILRFEEKRTSEPMSYLVGDGVFIQHDRPRLVAGAMTPCAYRH